MPREDVATGDREVFRTSGFVRFWSWTTLAIAAVLAIDVVRRGSIESSGWIALGVLFLLAALVWATGLRPVVVADDRRVLLRNLLRDVDAPWSAVTDIDAADQLRVHTEAGIHRSWAIQVPNRARRKAFDRRVQGPSGDPLDSSDALAFVGTTHADFVAGRLRERWELRRQHSAGDPTVSWALPTIAALLGAVLLIVVAVAVG
jgi:hypothetical protein